MYYAEPSESIKIFFIKFVLFAYHPSTTAKKEIPYRIQKICIMEKELPPMDKHKRETFVCTHTGLPLWSRLLESSMTQEVSQRLNF